MIRNWWRRIYQQVAFPKMVLGVSKDESILEREKGQGYIISIDGKMEQYESPGSSPGDD